MGWSDFHNGNLLTQAEAAFDLIITTDQNLRYQQNLTGRKLSILVLPTTSWPVIKTQVEAIQKTIETLEIGEYRELTFSPPS